MKLTMKTLFRKNQIVISALAVMIAVAGYLTYAGRDGDAPKTNQAGTVNESQPNTYSIGDLEIGEADILAENQALENANAGESSAVITDIESMDHDPSDTLSNPGEAVLTSGMTVADFMAQVKMNREQVRGKNKDTLTQIVNSDGATTEEKQAAINQIAGMADLADRENAAETLLKAKGFDNVIVSIADNKVDVVVCKAQLSDTERAQVEDIVKRKTSIGIESIVITPMEVGGN